MIVLLVLFAVALALSLAVNLGIFRSRDGHAEHRAAPVADSAPQKNADDGKTRELEKKLQEVKATLRETQDELRAHKKKLFDESEARKSQGDLQRARADVERQASLQLEATRAKLAEAEAEIARRDALRGPSSPAPKPRPVEAAPVQRVIRELSDADRERIARIEAQAASSHRRMLEAEKHAQALIGRAERMKREGKRVYAESKLAVDKFRAIEVRMNRCLLENDLLRRAIAELERRTGHQAPSTTPTTEELTAADHAITARHAEEDRAEQEVRDRLEASAAVEETATPEQAATTPEAPATNSSSV